jgi:nucleoside-diphosphate-sugar epimerase
MANKILITSAAGKISKVLSPLLLQNEYNLRAFVHSDQSGKQLKQALADAGGNLENVVGDLENPADVKNL